MKYTLLSVLTLLIVLSLSGCDDSGKVTCKEAATGVTINPDPAFLNQPVTIYISPERGVAYLQYITIEDASGNIVKEYKTSIIVQGSPKRKFPSEVTYTGAAWRVNDTFASGVPGRWTLKAHYISGAGSETKTSSGSFCMNESTTPARRITGDVVKPPSDGVEVPKLIDVKTFKRKYSIEEILPENFISINGNRVANPEVDERGDIVEFDGGVTFVLVEHDWRPQNGVAVYKFQGMAVLTYQNNKPILSYGIFSPFADRVKIELKDLGVGGGKFNIIVTMEDTTSPEGKPYPLDLRSYDLVLYSFDGTRLKKLFFSENWGGSGPYSIGDSDKDGTLDIVGDRLFVEWTGKGFGDSSESTYVEEIEE